MLIHIGKFDPNPSYYKSQVVELSESFHIHSHRDIILFIIMMDLALAITTSFKIVSLPFVTHSGDY